MILITKIEAYQLLMTWHSVAWLSIGILFILTKAVSNIGIVNILEKVKNSECCTDDGSSAKPSWYSICSSVDDSWPVIKCEKTVKEVYNVVGFLKNIILKSF